MVALVMAFEASKLGPKPPGAACRRGGWNFITPHVCAESSTCHHAHAGSATTFPTYNLTVRLKTQDSRRKST
eukprot:5211000-Amphidinium_carterae.1